MYRFVAKFVMPFLGCLLSVVSPAVGEERPNVIIIIADDMGFGDINYNGGQAMTPNLDAMARTGIRLDRFYAHPVCSPTRASLMTSQSPQRTGVQRPFFNFGTNSLDLAVKILPEYFQEAGYQTVLSGKWHLGHSAQEMLPKNRGFDSTYGFYNGGIGHYDHVSGGGYDWHRNGYVLREEGYATHLLTDEAVKRIKARDKDTPLFLYLSYSAPHLPNEAPEGIVEKYAHIDSEQERIHAAMIDEMDAGIGQVMKALDDENIRDNTIIWFFSDNGGRSFRQTAPMMKRAAGFIETVFGKSAPIPALEFFRSYMTEGGANNGLLRNGKGSVYEGGIRVPSILHWPGGLQGAIHEGRVTVHDILPTLADVAGLDLLPDQLVEGASMRSMFEGAGHADIPVFFTMGSEGQAVLHREWKMIQMDEDNVELYDILSDPDESLDLAEKRPDIVAKLQEKLGSIVQAEPKNDSVLDFLITPDSFGGEENREPFASKKVAASSD